MTKRCASHMNNFFVQLDTWFTYLIWSFLCCVFSVLYCSVTLYCSVLLFFLCVLYCSFLLYFTVSACDVSAATLIEVFRTFSSVVRQMPGYNSQTRGTARTFQVSFKFFDCYVCSVFCILCVVCV
jgi:hypothetical protein